MYKMLIADDEELVRRGMRVSVDWARHGILVAGEAKDGAEAMERIRELLPEVVITDIRMPKMDGLELIKQIKSEFPAIKVIILSGYEDFNYAQNAIRHGAFDYLVKPIEVESVLEVVKKACREIDEEVRRVKDEENLRKMVRESLPILKDKFLMELLCGETEVKDIKGKFDFLKLKIQTENFVVMTVEVDDCYTITKEMDIEDRHLMTFSIKNITEEVVSEYNNAEVFEINEYKIVVLANFHSNEPEGYEINKLLEVCNKTRYYIGKYLDITVSIGIGRFYKQPGHISSSFKESKRALEYKLFLGKDQTIHINDVEPEDRSETKIEYPFDKESNVVSTLRIGDVKGVEKSTDDFFGAIAEYSNASPQEIKRTCMRFLYTMSHILLELNIEVNQITSGNIVFESEISRCDTVEEIKSWVKELLRNAASQIFELKNNRNVEFVKKAMEYINKNYFKNLTVQDVAENIYLTPNYLSNIFKQETGKTVLEYITKTKIQFAQEFLKDPDLKTSEVAEMVGYKDPKYFSQLFKKYTGLTPSGYRCKAARE